MNMNKEFKRNKAFYVFDRGVNMYYSFLKYIADIISKDGTTITGIEPTKNIKSRFGMKPYDEFHDYGDILDQFNNDTSNNKFTLAYMCNTLKVYLRENLYGNDDLDSREYAGVADYFDVLFSYALFILRAEKVFFYNNNSSNSIYVEVVDYDKMILHINDIDRDLSISIKFECMEIPGVKIGTIEDYLGNDEEFSSNITTSSSIAIYIDIDRGDSLGEKITQFRAIKGGKLINNGDSDQKFIWENCKSIISKIIMDNYYYILDNCVADIVLPNRQFNLKDVLYDGLFVWR